MDTGFIKNLTRNTGIFIMNIITKLPYRYI